MWWVVIIMILIILGALPIGVYGVYNNTKAELLLILGPIRLRINNAERKPKTQKKKRTSDEFASHKTLKKKTSGRNVERYVSLLNPILRFLTDFRTRLRINELSLKVILAGDDPCDLSINYGRAWIALGNITPHLERYFVIRKRNLEIQCDYLGEKTTVEATIHLTITVFRLLQIVIYHGITILREYYRIIKNTKDGAIV